ncbi:neutral amino acid transporter [Dissophora globulifera]|nr:neutral amino acid transporter [Dissophora globulifera]
MENSYPQTAAPERFQSDISIHPSTITTAADSSTALVARSKSTRKLLASHSAEDLFTRPAPAHDDEQLHAIVGQHLFIPETNQAPDNTSLLSNSSSGVTAADSSTCGLGQRLKSPSTSDATALEESGSSTTDGSVTLNSHFQLQGAADANDVYKWHEKQTRRQLGPRSHSYHVPHIKDPAISAIKMPGGFRRHFMKQDAIIRGEPTPHMHTKSFLHYLGLFNLYDMEHFAGDDYRITPKRSSVLPKGMGKQHLSKADTVDSGRYLIPDEELDEEKLDNEKPEEKMSFSKTIGMLFKSFIASGILFLPNAFKNGGIVFSALFMVLIAVLCLHSFLLLVKCRESYPGSYGEIGQHLYGRWMRYIVLFAIAISQFGFCCGYCIFFAQQFAIVVDSLGGAYLDKLVWIAIFFVILIPFTLARNIAKLGFSSLVADLCIIVGLVYLYAYDVKELVNNQGSPVPLQLFNSNEFGLFIGTAVFSFEGIGMVIPICSSMAEPKQFPRALTIVLSVVCMLLVSFGSLGYAAYGDNVQTIVLDDLRSTTPGEKAGKNAIQLLYIIAVFLTTPLMLFPCIRIMEHAVLRGIKDTSTGRVRTIKENVVRILIDLAVAIVAYAGYSKLDIFISFIGSFACAPLLFIFPPLFHLRAFPGQPLWRKVSDVILILFGFLVFSYTLVTTIQSFSKST